MAHESNKPVHVVRLGRIKAAVWQHDVESRRLFSATIVRLYKDGPYWKESSSFDRDDLLLVAKVADRVHSWIFDQAQEHDGSPGNEQADASHQEF
jgi:hypothetical protein